MTPLFREKVDDAIKNFVDAGQKRAGELLKKHKKELDAVSEKLLEIETLDGDEFASIMGFAKAK